MPHLWTSFRLNFKFSDKNVERDLNFLSYQNTQIININFIRIAETHWTWQGGTLIRRTFKDQSKISWERRSTYQHLPGNAGTLGSLSMAIYHRLGRLASTQRQQFCYVVLHVWPRFEVWRNFQVQSLRRTLKQIILSSGPGECGQESVCWFWTSLDRLHTVSVGPSLNPINMLCSRLMWRAE